MKNTVFVFGAGFSAPAQMPIQADIMGLIAEHYSVPLQDTVRETVRSFFGILDERQMKTVPLEDIFTFLDRARKSGGAFIGVSREDISRSYEHLLGAVIREFERSLKFFDGRQGCYNAFFEELIRVRVEVGQEADPFALITLNWDTIPDFLVETLGKTKNVGVDYGCYDYDLADRDKFIPSIRRKGQGVFNMKLLKLHGSVNWLSCACCGRLYSDNSSATRPQVNVAGKFTCKSCDNVALENLIITPTLVKDIGNSHLQNIWHNGLLDLQAADRIIFVGYSFPLADFEFRYMLLKAIVGKPSKEIRVVLYPPDEGISPQEEWERGNIKERYENFFGNMSLEFKPMDAADFMNNPRLIWDW